MQVEIKFKRTGSNSVYGSFAAGDLMRCSQEAADHFVGQGLAKFVEAPATETAKVEPVKKPKRK